MNKTIILDFGHGGGECGAVANGLVEKDENLKSGLILKKRLEKHGFKCICTRTKDIKLSLSERANIANKNYNNDKNTMFFSFHHNGYTEDARGSETYRSIHNSKGSRISKCCDLLLSEMKKLGFIIRGNKTRESKKYPGQDYYTVIHKTKMKAVIFEPFFLTNKKDVEFGLSVRNEIVEAIVKSICWYYETKYIPIKEEPKENPKSKYMFFVQTGAFKNKENAKKQVKQLKTKGFNAVIKTEKI